MNWLVQGIYTQGTYYFPHTILFLFKAPGLGDNIFKAGGSGGSIRGPEFFFILTSIKSYVKIAKISMFILLTDMTYGGQYKVEIVLF